MWPGDSLTIPKMALSIGFTCFVSSTRAIQATGLLTLALAGLSPAECASLQLGLSRSLLIFSERRLVIQA